MKTNYTRFINTRTSISKYFKCLFNFIIAFFTKTYSTISTNPIISFSISSVLKFFFKTIFRMFIIISINKILISFIIFSKTFIFLSIKIFFITFNTFLIIKINISSSSLSFFTLLFRTSISKPLHLLFNFRFSLFSFFFSFSNFNI